MRFILATGITLTGVLITSCVSASAAAVHHARPRVAHYGVYHPHAGVRGAWARFPGPGESYETPRLPGRFDDTPSYDDPSKRGGY
jgi:hypothetical protein